MIDDQNIKNGENLKKENIESDTSMIEEGKVVDSQTDSQPSELVTEEPKAKKGLFNRPCKNCEKIKKECEEYKTGWQRALADYKNLQTEIAKRRGEWAKLSEAMILEEFLPVYEHLKMSISVIGGSASGGNNEQLISESNPWIDGVKFVIKQFKDILLQHDVEEIKTVGEKFDPRYHEAVTEELAENKEPGIIVREIQGGYKIGEKVIKAAKVIISKNSD